MARLLAEGYAPDEIGLHRVAPGYALVTGRYNLNVSCDAEVSTLAAPYADMPEEDALAFAAAELMQNVMDWALQRARARAGEAAGRPAERLVRAFADSFRVDAVRSERSGKITGFSVREAGPGGAVVVAARAVPGVGLCVLQSGVDALDAETCFTMAVTTKAQKRRREEAEPEERPASGGGYGMGLKQLFVLCQSRGWPLEVWGTVRGAPEHVNHVSADPSRGAAVVLSGEVVLREDPSYAALVRGLGVDASALADRDRALVHVLGARSSSKAAASAAWRGHAALCLSGTMPAFSGSNAVLYDGPDAHARMYVNGVFSGTYWSGAEASGAPDVLVAGRSFTTHVRGGANAYVVMNALAFDMAKECEPEALAALCDRAGAAGRALREFAPVEGAAALKNVVADSAYALKRLTSGKDNAGATLVFARDFAAEREAAALAEGGWLPEGFRFTFEEAREEEDPLRAWLSEEINDLDFNSYTPPRWLRAGGGVEEFCLAALRAKFAAQNSARECKVLRAFNQFVLDTGGVGKTLLWAEPLPAGSTQMRPHHRSFEVPGVGTVRCTNTWEDLRRDFSRYHSAATEAAEKIHLMWCYFRVNAHDAVTLRGANITFRASTESSLARNVAQTKPE